MAREADDDVPWASAAGRILGVFSVVGIALGIGVVFGLWAFDALGGGSGDVGAAVFGAFILMGGYLFVLMGGLVVAAVGGHYAGRNVAGAGRASAAGALGGAIGHLLLLVTFTLVVGAGFAVLGGDSGQAQDGTQDGSGSGAALGQDGVPDPSAFGKMALAVVPAGIVGGVTARLFTSTGSRGGPEPDFVMETG